MNHLSFANKLNISEPPPFRQQDDDFSSEDEEELSSIMEELNKFNTQRNLSQQHSELLGSHIAPSFPVAPVVPVKNVAEKYETLEKEIRKQRATTKRLRTEQNKLEPFLVEHLEKMPNSTAQTNDMTFSIKTRKKRKRMDPDHIIECLASYSCHYKIYPQDDRKNEFSQLHQQIDDVNRLRAQNPSDDTLIQEQIRLNNEKRNLYTLFAMDQMRYIERSRTSEIVPFLSRRAKKKRKIS